MLYFRMLLTMGVSLYTVRVVLATLGAVDYGLYNVVAGIVTMFSFLSGTMASASQRFFSFELGRENYEQLKKTFSITFTIYVMIALVILVLAETLGLWFLNYRMMIPPDRLNAVHWVYQFSILSFMMTMFGLPYNAAIIAHEKMGIYAWGSIIEVSLKLIIVYFLVVFSVDKLKLYAVLVFGVTAIVTLFYRSYCRLKFDECRFSFYWEKRLFFEITSFSGWNMVGAMANVLKLQGVSILLNVFFNPVVNAARAIAMQVNTAMTQLAVNFYMALRPQIVKSYAAKEFENLNTLVVVGSKLGFFLMMLLSVPLLIETKYILSLWLTKVPEYSVVFSRLMIINSLIDAFNYPLVNAIQASGKIKWFQVFVSSMILFNLPVSFLFYKFGFPPESAMVVSIIITIFCFIPRIYFAYKDGKISYKKFFYGVIVKTLPIFITVLVLIYALTLFIAPSFFRLLITILSSTLLSVLLIYYAGLIKEERLMVISYIKKITGKC